MRMRADNQIATGIHNTMCQTHLPRVGVRSALSSPVEVHNHEINFLLEGPNVLEDEAFVTRGKYGPFCGRFEIAASIVPKKAKPASLCVQDNRSPRVPKVLSDTHILYSRRIKVPAGLLDPLQSVLENMVVGKDD